MTFTNWIIALAILAAPAVAPAEAVNCDADTVCTSLAKSSAGTFELLRIEEDSRVYGGLKSRITGEVLALHGRNDDQ